MTKEFPPKLEGTGLLGPGPILNPNTTISVTEQPLTTVYGFEYETHQFPSGTGVFLPGFSSAQRPNPSKRNHIHRFHNPRYQFQTLHPVHCTPFRVSRSGEVRKGTGVFLPRVIDNEIRMKPSMKIVQQPKESTNYKVAEEQEAPSIDTSLEFNLPQEWTY